MTLKTVLEFLTHKRLFIDSKLPEIWPLKVAIKLILPHGYNLLSNDLFFSSRNYDEPPAILVFEVL